MISEKSDPVICLLEGVYGLYVLIPITVSPFISSNYLFHGFAPYIEIARYPPSLVRKYHTPLERFSKTSGVSAILQSFKDFDFCAVFCKLYDRFLLLLFFRLPFHVFCFPSRFIVLTLLTFCSVEHFFNSFFDLSFCSLCVP